MKNRKMAAAFAAAVVLVAASGCGAQEQTPEEVPTIQMGDARQPQENDAPEEDASTEENALQKGAPTEGSASTSQESIPTDVSTLTGNGESEMAYLPGKVRTINDDSVVISRTFIKDDGTGSSQVYIPEKGSADEELVTVRFAEDTKFEHWTIVSGGAEIERRDASFADISENLGLEMYGHYEDDEFVAQRVIIEVDV